MRTRLKICCIAPRDEARLAVEAGADAPGLVSAMPSGLGVIPDATLAAVAAAVPPPAASVLLTSRTDPHAIAEQQRAAGTSTLQLVAAVAHSAHRQLTDLLPGVRRLQVVHLRMRATSGPRWATSRTGTVCSWTRETRTPGSRRWGHRP